MICIDTSIWVQYFRGKEDDLTSQVHELLDEGAAAIAVPVWIELLSAAEKRERDRIGKLFSALPRLFPTRSTWKVMEQWSKVAAEKGHRFGMGDLLIGAIAFENESKVWSLDTDFERMARLKFIKSY